MTRKVTATGTIISEPKFLFEQMAIDLFEKDGDTYFIAIELLSRYAWIIKITSKAQLQYVIRRLLFLIPTPGTIISDDENAIKSTEVLRLYEEEGIQHVQISAYHPESNGICERVIGTIRNLSNSQTAVSCAHPLINALKTYNATIHSTTGFSPVEVLFGKQPEIDPTIQERNKQREAIREVAKEKIRQKKEKNLILQNKRVTGKMINYQVGDLIPHKRRFQGTWSEPTVIKEINQLTKTVTIGNKQTRHFNEIRPLHRPEGSIIGFHDYPTPPG
ncbi:uncharacterized protein K02A2.6-like [Belonocnema kinseyi]|uniref:uncharacterized protein K02A2.6-like n=1 Tax=Belonocnema kinseyi TaxID=2817044 RepID=UPI00143D200F|nr:uncharacterized protein K02A2.6-like [Belonocnema kinseyi]